MKLVLRPKQVQQELGMSQATFYRLVKAGKIPTIKMSPATTGVESSALEAYLKSLRA